MYQTIKCLVFDWLFCRVGRFGNFEFGCAAIFCRRSRSLWSHTRHSRRFDSPNHSLLLLLLIQLPVPVIWYSVPPFQPWHGFLFVSLLHREGNNERVVRVRPLQRQRRRRVVKHRVVVPRLRIQVAVVLVLLLLQLQPNNGNNNSCNNNRKLTVWLIAWIKN